MSPLAWVVVASILTRGTVEVTRAGLSYRTQKRRDQAKEAK